jgi:murein DD-endopeptidase MepM/ murein hydrolase activator NlpD
MPVNREGRMRQRLGRWSIAATLLATLLVPAAGSIAGTHKELHKTKAELGALRNRIQADSAHAHTLRGEIDVLNAQIGALQQEINALDEHIARIETRVRSSQARIDATQGEIDAIKDRAIAQARVLYESGGTSTLDALLGSESLSELDSRLEMLGIAAQKNTGTLIEYGRLREEIEAEHAVLFSIQQDLDAELDDRSKTYDQLGDQRLELATKLTQLRGKLAKEHDHEEGLAEQADALRDKIIAKQAQRSVTSLGTSAQGFIWPLNGPINSPYGPRWGSFHPGIDIDGYTGEPIVAAKDGVVIMAGPYSGYGNATIIDHGGGIATLYGHQTSINVSNGQHVKQGDVIGTVGCTGYCTGPHLHFEVRVNGDDVDPMPYLP